MTCLKEIFSNLSQSTIKSYTVVLNKMKKEFDSENYEYIIQSKRTINYINNLELGNKSKEMYLNAVFGYIKHSGLYKTKQQNYYIQLQKLKSIINNENIEKTNDGNKWGYNELKDFIETIQYPMEYTLLALQFYYTKRTDLRTIKIRNIDKDKDNFLDYKNKKIVYNYRLKMDAGKIEDDLSDYWDRLKIYFNIVLNKKKQVYLFENSDDKMCNKDSYRKLLYLAFATLGIEKERWLNSNDFRHIVATEFANKPLKKKIEVAQSMGHSLQQQIFYKRDSSL